MTSTSRVLRAWALPSIPQRSAKRDFIREVAHFDMEYTALRDGGRFLLSFGNLAQFTVSFDERCIAISDGSQEKDPATLDHLLYDHVIPRVIAATGPLVLHGSAVEIDGRLAIFIGETGAGKSTLSASLLRKGYRLLGDDAVVITEVAGKYFGEAVYPSLRLYPETIAEILGEGLTTAPMAEYSDKRHVIGFAQDETDTGPLPLGHIFVLAASDDMAHLDAMSPREACMAMIGQSFALDPDDIDAATQRMKQVVALASRLPVSRLSYPHDFALLPQVHRLIEERLTQPTPAAQAKA